MSPSLKRRSAASLALVLAIGLSAGALQNQSPSIIDGSKTPELVPDEEMYALLLLTASAPSSGAKDEEARRARAFTAALPLGAQDQKVFAEHARAYRHDREDDPAGMMAAPAAEFLRRRRDLAQAAIRNLHAGLSDTGSAQIKSLVQHEKRAVKLFPLPPMNGPQPMARGWFERLLAQLVPTVHAQSMGYGGLYTSVTVDIDGNVFGYR